MALNIKNQETEKLARELARRRGQGITEVLTDILRREVERERRKLRPDDIEARMRRIDEIVKRHQRRPLRDDRPADEIIGYNKQGLFD
jgi:antitoxin VapB